MELVVLLLVVVFYCLPGLIALSREHHNAWAIVALNILIGWTVLGWIISFVWSLTAVRRPA